MARGARAGVGGGWSSRGRGGVGVRPPHTSRVRAAAAEPDEGDEVESRRRPRAEGLERHAGLLEPRVGRVGDGAARPRAGGLERRAGRLELGVRDGAERLDRERRAGRHRRGAGGIGDTLRGAQELADDGRRGAEEDGADGAMQSGESRSNEDGAGEGAGIPKPRSTGNRPRGRRGGEGKAAEGRGSRDGAGGDERWRPPAGSREPSFLTDIFR